MPYDTMTETDWEEYEMLYANPPTTITGLAERFLYLAEKGWTGTRAADDCFEMGNGNYVLPLILRQVKTDSKLKDILKSQGAWLKNWDEILLNWDESVQPIVIQFEWNGITIECAYNPQWSKAVEGLAHFQIWSVDPLKARLPITETGYRSHFSQTAEPLDESKLIALVHDWLNEAAQSPEWIAYQQDQMQLTLF